MSYTNKTAPTAVSPEQYLKDNFGGSTEVINDALQLIEIFSKVTGSRCVMWGKIFGFGKYHYNDSTGGSHDYLVTGFAISKTGFTLYNISGWENYKSDIESIGKYKLSGKSCMAIKRFADIDSNKLKIVITKSVKDLKAKYKTEM